MKLGSVREADAVRGDMQGDLNSQILQFLGACRKDLAPLGHDAFTVIRASHHAELQSFY
jgi:hypothetical protein